MKSILAGSLVVCQRYGACCSLFEDGWTTSTISCIFSNFYVDHNEPLKALAAYKAGRCWVPGELLEGHKFLIIFPARKPVTPPDVFQ